MSLQWLTRVCLVLFVAVFSQFSHAADWSHVHLNGVSSRHVAYQISVDYQISEYIYSGGKVATADPVWINVYGQNLNPNSAVKVYIYNYLPDFRYGYNREPEYIPVHLHYAGNGRFTGDIPYGLKTSVHNRQQELKVEVDGELIYDTVSWRQAFGLDLYKSR